MVKRHSADCDMCGARDISSTEVSLTVGRLPDPAGGTAMDDTVDLDICWQCAARFIGILKSTVSITYAEATEVLKKVNDIRANHKNEQPRKRPHPRVRASYAYTCVRAHAVIDLYFRYWVFG